MALEIRKEDIREDEPKNKIEYQSFSLSLSYETDYFYKILQLTEHKLKRYHNDI
jgi:hypothetical protein